MDSLDISNIAIGALIVGILNLIIIVLVKTETILEQVERIKGIIRLDYKARAKRTDDEIRLLKRYEKIAKERVKYTFITMEKWECKWTWTWDNDLNPVYIRGFCTGNSGKDIFGQYKYFDCSHPVHASFAKGPKEKLYYYVYIGIYCSQEGSFPHKHNRAYFEVPVEEDFNGSAEDVTNELIRKAIITEKDRRIVREIKKLRFQFWR